MVHKKGKKKKGKAGVNLLGIDMVERVTTEEDYANGDQVRLPLPDNIHTRNAPEVHNRFRSMSQENGPRRFTMPNSNNQPFETQGNLY